MFPMEFPLGNELLIGKFQTINANLWGISGGTKISGFSNQFLRILFMGKYEGEMSIPGRISK